MKLPFNEPVLEYRRNSKERMQLEEMIASLKNAHVEMPMFIGNEKVTTQKKINIHPPHDHQYILGHFYEGGKDHVISAIEAALKSKENWAATPSEKRIAIFLKAAELLSTKYRAKINAATMLGQSKNVYQAEIDAACELIDFLRFNAFYLTQLENIQPHSPEGINNNMVYRPLEGFIVAITPFNFTAIAGNLPLAPALMGNTVVWKPAYAQIYSAHVIMDVLQEAGLPAGVINLIYVDGPVLGEVAFTHPLFSGLHFTGSTKVFDHLWKTISSNLTRYKSYPKIVGETGGKDFVLAHSSASIPALITALIRGAFEYQGQKCSAASRAYIPASIWPEVKSKLVAELQLVKMGPVEDFTHFVNAVIDLKAFERITGYIERAKIAEEVEFIFGGDYSKEKGYFISPTVLVTTNPHYETMVEEIFGPILTLYIYPDQAFESILSLVDNTSDYALTGSLFATEKKVISLVLDKLNYSAGNFYLNDKPTGAVVNQQPFGGSRRSGTNDKAGSLFNLIRWTSPLTIKENLNPPTHFGYPFME